jgi:hypothetical protein
MQLTDVHNAIPSPTWSRIAFCIMQFIDLHMALHLHELYNSQQVGYAIHRSVFSSRSDEKGHVASEV